jgi:hypothetical protein
LLKVAKSNKEAFFLKVLQKNRDLLSRSGRVFANGSTSHSSFWISERGNFGVEPVFAPNNERKSFMKRLMLAAGLLTLALPSFAQEALQEETRIDRLAQIKAISSEQKDDQIQTVDRMQALADYFASKK